eukprot:766099-Hanusia_phi.AAC.8
MKRADMVFYLVLLELFPEAFLLEHTLTRRVTPGMFHRRGSLVGTISSVDKDESQTRLDPHIRSELTVLMDDAIDLPTGLPRSCQCVSIPSHARHRLDVCHRLPNAIHDRKDGDDVDGDFDGDFDGDDDD